MERRIQFQPRVEPGSRGRGEWITRPNLEGGACVPGIETTYFEPEIAEFIHEPWRHISGLDSYAGINSRMPADQNVGLFWNRGHWPRHRLRTALSTIQMAVILCDTSNPTSSMNLRPRESSGETARIAALSAIQAPMAIEEVS
jgi:hypothetical protein